MPALSKTAIENLAIAYLPAKQITSDEENSLEAQQCRIWYPEALQDILGGEHNWSFANRRVVLAELASNDRESEWAYAYAVPNGVGNAIRVLPDFDALGLSLPVPLPGQPYAETWAPYGLYVETPYIIEGETLYSNVSGATLEYTIGDVAGVNVPQLFIKALSLDLAAKLAMPVKKDSERETKLQGMAEMALQRAIADDRNRQPETDGQYVSEAMMARQGYLTDAA